MPVRPGRPVRGMVTPLQHFVILDVLWRAADGPHPDVIAGVHVDGRHAAVWRLISGKPNAFNGGAASRRHRPAAPARPRRHPHRARAAGAPPRLRATFSSAPSPPPSTTAAVDVVHVRRAGSLMSERRLNSVDEKMYAIFVSGSNAPPSQFVPPLLPGIMSMPNLPSWPRSIGGSNRLSLYLVQVQHAQCFGLDFRRPVVDVALADPCLSYAAGFVG